MLQELLRCSGLGAQVEGDGVGLVRGERGRRGVALLQQGCCQLLAVLLEPLHLRLHLPELLVRQLLQLCTCEGGQHGRVACQCLLLPVLRERLVRAAGIWVALRCLCELAQELLRVAELLLR